MRAFVSLSPGPIEAAPLVLKEVSTPVPEPRELLVRVEACGVCRTDLHVVEGDLPRKKTPIIPGHQVVGRVVARGSACRSGQDGIQVGERVGIAWLRSTCGACEFCASGQENLCESSVYTGYHHDGGYAEFVTVPEAFTYRLPENTPAENLTPLLCAGIIGYRALRRSNLQLGGTLAIFGFGSSAHITMQIAKRRGSRVIVATRGASHRELAKTLGADWTGDTFDPLPEKAHSAIIFAPAGEIIPHALRNLRKGGTVALAGIHMSPCPAMEYEPHLFHEKNLVSVEANTRADGHELFLEAERHSIRPEIVSFPFEQANEALRALKQDGIRGTAVLTFPRINS